MHQAADVRREADAYAHSVLQKLREQIGQVARPSTAACPSSNATPRRYRPSVPLRRSVIQPVSRRTSE